MAALGNARSIVIDDDLHPAFVLLQRHLDMLAMLEGVVDQIGGAALDRLPPDRQHHARGRVHRQPLRARAARLGGRQRRVMHDVGQIGRLRILARLAAGEIQIFVQHVLHLGDVVFHRLGIRFGHHRQFQLHARQRCLDVVADAREHLGALLHIALDAFAHGDEGLRRAAHLGRAVRLEVGHRPALAEAFRRLRQPFDRPHLPAQEQDRHRQQHQRGNHHPQHEHIRIGDFQPLYRQQHAQHAILHLHAHFGMVVLDAGREGPGLAQCGPERGVERPAQIGRGMAIGLAQAFIGNERYLVLQIARRHVEQLRALGAGRLAFFQVDEEGHIRRHAPRHARGHDVVMAHEEGVGYEALQQHHRRHDDDERAPEEPARQPAFQDAKGARPVHLNSHGPARAHNPRRAPSGCKAAASDRPRSCGAGASPAHRWNVPASR